MKQMYECLISKHLHVKGELSGVGKLRSRIWNDHLDERKTIENGTDFSVIIICDSRERNALPVTESCRPNGRQLGKVRSCQKLIMGTDVHFPFLPLQFMTIHLEADAFGLHNMKWFDIVSWFMFWVFS
jgi:hypothetical protein